METATVDLTPIQTLINNKASKRLQKDMAALSEAVAGSNILRQLGNVQYNKLPKIQLEGEEGSLNIWALFSANSSWNKAAKALLLPVYIEQETKAFLDKVDNLQSQIDALHNAAGDDDLPY